METFKRLITIYDETGASFGILRLKEAKDGFLITMSLVDKNLSISPLNLFFYNGLGYFCPDYNGYCKCDNYLNGLSCAIITDNKIIAYGKAGQQVDKEGFICYAKTIKKQKEDTVKTENCEYDDFKIASENYFNKKEDLDEYQYTDNDGVKTKCDIKGQKTQFKIPITEDEKHPCNSDKSCYKPENQSTCPDEHNKDRSFINKKSQIDFLNIVCNKQRVYDLQDLIPDSKFYKMGDGKYYLFGLIFKNGYVEYLAYLVPAEYGNPPTGFEDALFVPQSYFNYQRGYYGKFQSVDK